MANAKRERQRANRQLGLEEAKQNAETGETRRKVFIVAGIIVAALLAALWYSIASKSDDEDLQTQTTEQSSDADVEASDGGATATGQVADAEPTPCPPFDGSGPTQIDFAAAPPMCIDESKNYVAVFDTSMGEITAELDVDNTPMTANNFAVLAGYHYYDNTEIFRSDTSIDILQGGSPHTNSAADPGPGYTIDDEGSGYTYEPGQLVMARTGAPNSSGAQFFIVTGENAEALNSQGTYVVFGNITEGLDVAQDIIATHVEDPDSGLGGRPTPTVFINSVSIEES